MSFVFTNGPIVSRLNNWDYDGQCQMGAGNKPPGLTGWDRGGKSNTILQQVTKSLSTAKSIQFMEV